MFYFMFRNIEFLDLITKGLYFTFKLFDNLD